MQAVLVVSLGAVLGALGRWELGKWLNASSKFPVGTFVANMVGAFIIGVASSWLVSRPDLSQEWKLFIITGFLGSLTTFSSFSLETVTNIMAGRWQWAVLLVFSHVVGALLFTILGIMSFNLVK